MRKLFFLLIICLTVSVSYGQRDKLRLDSLKVDYTLRIKSINRTPFFDRINSSNELQTAAIENLAVTTAKINDAAITTAKLNDGAVTSAKTLDSSLVKADLSNQIHQWVESAGGGSITNQTDGVTTQVNGSSEIYVDTTNMIGTKSWTNTQLTATIKGKSINAITHIQNNAFVNVMDYALVADSATSNNTKLKLIRSTAGTNATIYLPDGNYVWGADSIQLLAGTTIKGQSRQNTRIIFNDAIAGSGGPIYAGDNCVFEDITFVQNTDDNVIIQDGGSAGITVEYRNCDFINNSATSSTGFIRSYGSKTYGYNCIFTNENASEGDTYSFEYVSRRDTSYWDNCTFKGYRYGFGGTRGMYAEFNNCHISHAKLALGAALNPYGGCHIVFNGGSLTSNNTIIASTRNWTDKRSKTVIKNATVHARHKLYQNDGSPLAPDSVYWLNNETTMDTLDGSPYSGFLPDSTYLCIKDSKFYHNTAGERAYFLVIIDQYGASEVVINNVNSYNCGFRENVTPANGVAPSMTATNLHCYTDKYGEGYPSNPSILGLRSLKGHFKHSSFVSADTSTRSLSRIFDMQHSTLDSLIWDYCIFQNLKTTTITVGSNMKFNFCKFRLNAAIQILNSAVVHFTLSEFEANATYLFTGTGSAYMNGCVSNNYSQSGSVSILGGSIIHDTNFYSDSLKVGEL